MFKPLVDNRPTLTIQLGYLTTCMSPDPKCLIALHQFSRIPIQTIYIHISSPYILPAPVSHHLLLRGECELICNTTIQIPTHYSRLVYMGYIVYAYFRCVRESELGTTDALSNQRFHIPICAETAIIKPTIITCGMRNVRIYNFEKGWWLDDYNYSGDCDVILYSWAE